MFIFSEVSGSAVLTRGMLLLALLLLAGCEDPTAPRPAPEVRALDIFLILDPDTTVQPVIVVPVSLAPEEDSLEELSAELYRGETLVAAAIGPTDTLYTGEVEPVGTAPCIDRYGSLRGTYIRCPVFEFSPQFATTYRLKVSAADRPTATATTTVPGDFEVLEVRAQGTDPPGSEGLLVRWTKSENAYRYLVALRATVPPWCVEYPDPDACTPGGTNVAPDRQGWYAVSKDTVLETVVDGEAAEQIASGKGPWYVDVYAVSKGLYEYLTTGTSGSLFPVPPAQNVEGGYGAVGAWVVRTMKIEE